MIVVAAVKMRGAASQRSSKRQPMADDVEPSEGTALLKKANENNGNVEYDVETLQK